MEFIFSVILWTLAIYRDNKNSNIYIYIYKISIRWNLCNNSCEKSRRRNRGFFKVKYV